MLKRITRHNGICDDERSRGREEERTDRLITMALGRGHSFARKLIKTLFLGCFFVFSGASSHLLEYLETTWKKKQLKHTCTSALPPLTHTGVST